MKALTLTQPWATLVAVGAKRIETRSWSTSFRGRLAIHAAKRMPREAALLCWQEPFLAALQSGGYQGDLSAPDNPFHLPLGAVVAIVTLDAVRPITPENILEEPERSFGDYTPGRYAWVLREVCRLSEPVAARGRLGLWEWSPE